jgi:hypothetical protein
MKKTLLALALAVAAGGAQAIGANPITLDALINGGSISAGDKLFSNWSQTFFGASNPQGAIDPTQILVTPLSDGGDNPGPGINIDFSNQMTVTGDGVYAYRDFTIEFNVSTIGDKQIKDNSLDFGDLPSVLTWTVDGLNDLGHRGRGVGLRPPGQPAGPQVHRIQRIGRRADSQLARLGGVRAAGRDPGQEELPCLVRRRHGHGHLGRDRAALLAAGHPRAGIARPAEPGSVRPGCRSPAQKLILPLSPVRRARLGRAARASGLSGPCLALIPTPRRSQHLPLGRLKSKRVSENLTLESRAAR